MQSNSMIDINPKPSDTVIVYRYRLDINNGSGSYAARDFSTIIEYYIPSSKICFNKYLVFKSEKPRNISPTKTFHLRSEPLTSITLSKKLIKQIEDTVEQCVSSENKINGLDKNEEYQSLFKSIRTKTILVDNCIVKAKVNFWERYQTKGNNVLKNALIQYILEDTTPEDTELKDLIELINKLTPTEKESIIDSIKATLSLEDGKLTEMRTDAINEIEKNRKEEVIDFGIKGSVGGAALSAILRLNPLVIGGLSFFAASIFKNTQIEDKKNNEDLSWNEREERAKKIIDAINGQLENDFKYTNS